ncbi:MAG: hypothetical protein AB1424_11080 [Thermodesulfobacteriota bacterium]
MPLICLAEKYLLAATLLVVAATIAFPYTPLAVFFNFHPLSLEFLALIGLILSCTSAPRKWRSGFSTGR